MPEIRISLDEKEFKDLVHGHIVEQDGVKIILKDIGFERMMKSIMMAIDSVAYQRGKDR